MAVKKQWIIQKLVWILKGFVLGFGMIVPGLSVGTLALVMSIYEKMVFSFTNLCSFFSQPDQSNTDRGSKKADIVFLFCLIVGILIAVLSGSKIITPFLHYFPLEIYSLFTGLILACLPMLLKHIQKNIKSFFLISITTLIFILFFQLTRGFSESSQPAAAWLALAGFLACFSALLPGISGSSVLVMMGVYHFLLQAVSEGKWSVLVVCAFSGLPALLLAFFTMRFLLKNKKSMTFCILFGLILGSLPVVFPVEHWLSSPNLLSGTIKAIIFLIIGFSILFFIEKKKLSN